MISCAQPGPAGGFSRDLASCGAMKSGRAATLFGLAAEAFALVGGVRPAGALSSRLLCQTDPACAPSAVMNGVAALPFPLAISAMVRLDATE